MSQYWYQNAVTNGTGSTLVNDVVGSLVQAITGSAATNAVTREATTNISTQLNANTPFKDLVAPDAGNTLGTNPKAYLTILFFDERFNYVGEGSRFQRVQENPGANASLVITPVKAPKNGYAFVYVSNESDEPVYFDNMQVVHERGRIIEENHYYAFGLKIAAISSRKLGDGNEGSLQNNYQYQGSFSEMDEDMGWNDFALRNYDAQIGRFVEQDPFQQFASPYTGMGNDPVNSVDPSGGSLLGLGSLGRAAVTTLGGAIIGMGADLISGGDGSKGLMIGAGIGLLSNFNLTTATKAVIQSANTAVTVINTSVNTSYAGSVMRGTNAMGHGPNPEGYRNVDRGGQSSSSPGGTPPIFWEEFLYPAIESIDFVYSNSFAGSSQSITVPSYPNVRFLVFHYEQNIFDQMDNRNKSEKANKNVKNPNPNFFDLHEVPYASTKEGGSRATMYPAPGNQNRGHGSSLKWFFKRNHLQDGDEFWVPLYKPTMYPLPVLAPWKNPRPAPPNGPWVFVIAQEILEGLMLAPL